MLKAEGMARVGTTQESLCLGPKHNQQQTCHSEAFFAEESDTVRLGKFTVLERHQIPRRGRSGSSE
jgi:hypothetical protein